MNKLLDSLIFKHKILLLLILPLITILILSVSFIYDKYIQRGLILNTSEYIKFNIIVNKLVNTLQEERDITFLQAHEEVSKDKILNIKRINTNNELFLFKKALKNKPFNKRSDEIIKSLDSLILYREKIDNKSSTLKNIKDIYTLNINQLFTYIEEIIKSSSTENIILLAQEYSFIAHAKEYLSQEKILLEYIFNNTRLNNEDFNDFISLNASQNIYKFNIKKIASKEDLLILMGLENKNIKYLRNIIFNKNEKNKLLANIKELAGYGGFIHNFKDYILKKDEKYSTLFQMQHSNLKRNINKYRRLKPFTKDEKQELKNIINVFDEYLDYSLDIQDSHAKNYSIKEINDLIIINDKKAIASIKRLTKNIYGADVNLWNKEVNKNIGIYASLEKDIFKRMLKSSDEIINNITFNLTLLCISIFLVILIIFILSQLIINRISKKLKSFEKGLDKFFEYSSGKNDTLELMKVKGNDEFAHMAKKINKQIIYAEQILIKDKIVIDEINDVISKVSNGFFSYEVYNEAGSKEVEELKKIINKMLRYTKNKIDVINKVLTSYSCKNYDYVLDEADKKGMNGDFGILLNSLILLGDSSSILVAMITNASLNLDKNSKVLTHSSSILSIASTKQAASLEETSSSIEEITSNMQNSTLKVNKMSLLANDLTSYAKQGNDLAIQTSISMNEINEKVMSINEAILIIDKIAFQTNILSLNAAVEAATAGEAGKGFAVVATEVRNLANRSAHAAKEIKLLVQDAASKSFEGKNTSNKMISGYEKLFKKVDETKLIIDDVSIISNEQKEGMIQINDAVNSLDKTTQKNASISNQIDSLSKDIDSLSLDLHSLTSIVTIDKRYLKRVKDLNLLQEISKYKNNHVNFKKKSFLNLNLFKNEDVINTTSYDLNLWLKHCEDENKNFTNSTTWKSLKTNHEDVHNRVHSYIQANANTESNEQLEKIAEDIEVLTLNIFNDLNDILELNAS